jgi:MFS family permease
MVSGFMNAPLCHRSPAVIQRSTVAEMRGRVASAYFVTSNAFFLIGMAAAGLADLIDVRILYLISAVLTIACGIWALVLPGLGQPAAEWRRALALLRSAPAVSGLGARRSVTPADMDLLVGLQPSLAGLARPDRERMISQGCVLDMEPGVRITRQARPVTAPTLSCQVKPWRVYLRRAATARFLAWSPETISARSLH